MSLALVHVQAAMLKRQAAVQCWLEACPTLQSFAEVNALRRLLSCRVGNRLGFGACAGFLVLFYLMPRNSFIQHLFHCDFTFLIRYHRQVLELCSPCCTHTTSAS